MEGYTGILARDLAPALDSRTNRYLENISDAAERMDRLIAALLDYGRLGHSEFPLRPVSCGGAVFEILQELGPRIVEAKASIAVPEKFPEVMGNEKLLELIFRQLVRNALTFVRPDVSPSITIRFTREVATHSAPLIRCWVEDNGIGIPAGREHKAFWIFERLHPGSAYPGIGMGLALASKAVERMQGKIGVETGEMEGSRFWFELPLAPDEISWEEKATDVYDASAEIAEDTVKVPAH
jgi:signal transduction histidine kinase